MITRLGEEGVTQMSLTHQWAEFMAAQGHSPATIGVRTRTLHALMTHAGVANPLDINRLHVASFLARPRAQWTRYTYWCSIRAWSDWLRDFEFDPTSDLTKGLTRPKTPEPVARPIDDRTIGALLAVRLNKRANAYVRLALFAGLRVHEIAKFKAEEIDVIAGWMTITGKGNSTKPLPIHPEIVKLSQSMPEIGYWFPARMGSRKYVTPEAVSATIGNALRMVGSNATAHQLRDTYATRIQREVGDIRITQSLLRHSSVKSTQKYTAVADADMTAAMDALHWGQTAA